MNSSNFVQVETKTGIKEFELRQGDITAPGFDVDLLCLSAFKDDYTPTKSSIIGQLYYKGINVEQLAQRPSLDFRDSLGIWVSEPIKNQFFKNIICTEITGHAWSFEKSIQNLFAVISILEIQGNDYKTIALPLLGAGDQEYDNELVISTLMPISLKFLEHSRYLQKVYFVVYNQEQFEEFDKEMDRTLGRIAITTPNSTLAQMLKADLNKNIDLLIELHSDQEVFRTLKRLINTNFRSFEFGAICRKSAECIINMLNISEPKENVLIMKIETLASKNISKWIGSYFHTIRILGNEAVHSSESKERTPANLDERDLEIGMYCMIKIIEFYLNEKKR